MRVDFKRWGVFNLVGICGFVVQIGVLALLTRLFGWPTLLATAVALELTALQNFAAHTVFTWSERRPARARDHLLRAWRYQIAHTASLAANVALTALIVGAGLPPELANTAAVIICAVPNYLASEHFVFQSAVD